jgi:ATP-dependent Clp protease ATP-binding subunit ClpA
MRISWLEQEKEALKAENERLKEEVATGVRVVERWRERCMMLEGELVKAQAKLNAKPPNPVSVERMAKLLLFHNSGMKWQRINDEEKEYWLHLAQALHLRIYGKGEK